MKTYRLSGTINADVSVPGCGITHHSGPVISGNLQLNYADINATIPVDYYFTFMSGIVTVNCQNGPPAQTQIVVAISCQDGTPIPTLSNESTLSGSYSCGTVNMLSSSWTFTSQ